MLRHEDPKQRNRYKDRGADRPEELQLRRRDATKIS